MKNKNNNCRQSDKNSTKQIRIDTGLHKLLKKKAIDEGMTVKSVLEDYLMDLLAVDNQKYEN
jgi:hypothetical protein